MSNKMTAQNWHDEYFKALGRERELESAMANAARNQSASNEENRQLKTALKAMVINAEYRYPHFEDENTEAHAALVNARALLDMGEPPKQ